MAQSEPGDRAVRSLPHSRPLRMAYYYPYDQPSLDSLQANIRRLDVVAPHWLTVDENGQVQQRVPPAALAVLRTADAVVLPSAALGSREAGTRVIGDPAVGAVAIQELVAAVAPWDGLALDFEGLDPSLREQLTQFIEALGAVLRAAGKTYAIALPAKTFDIRTGWAGAYDYPAIAGAADFYLVMTYGYRSSSSSIPGSTAPIAWVEASMTYAASVIPPERLVLGVAFYGYDWNITRGPPARALRHSDTRQLLAATGATPTLDPQTMSATFRYELDGEEHEVWFEDGHSVAAKLRVAGRRRLAGVGAWRLGQEDPSTWESWDLLLARPAARPQWPLRMTP